MDRTWTHTSDPKIRLVRMLLSFQRPPRPFGKVLPSLESALGPTRARGGPSSIAPTWAGLQGPALGGASTAERDDTGPRGGCAATSRGRRPGRAGPATRDPGVGVAAVCRPRLVKVRAAPAG